MAGNVKVAAPQEVQKDTGLPTVSISQSAPNILLATQARYSVSGACSENGQNVTVTLAAGSKTLTPNAAVTCVLKQWTAIFDASSLAEGDVGIAATTQDAVGNTSVTVTKTVVKDIVPPETLAFSQGPLSVINFGNASTYLLSGTCSEGGSKVAITLTDSAGKTASPSGVPTCFNPGGGWSAQLDASSLADGMITVSAQYSDAAGNVKVAAPQEVQKDTELPTVSISESASQYFAGHPGQLHCEWGL